MVARKGSFTAKTLEDQVKKDEKNEQTIRQRKKRHTSGKPKHTKNTKHKTQDKHHNKQAGTQTFTAMRITFWAPQRLHTPAKLNINLLLYFSAPHAGKRKMVLPSNRYDKVVDPVHLASDDQLRDHHGMVGGSPQCPRPPAHRTQTVPKPKQGRRFPLYKKTCRRSHKTQARAQLTLLITSCAITHGRAWLLAAGCWRLTAGSTQRSRPSRHRDTSAQISKLTPTEE